MASSSHPSRRALLRSRGLAAVATLTAVGVLTTGLASQAQADPTPSASAPTVASVTAQLADLAKKNEALSEQLNAATIDLTTKQKAATAAQASATKAQAEYQDALKQYGSSIVAQYKTGSLSRAGALLTSTSTQQYLDTMSDLATVSAHNNAQVNKLTTAKQTAAAATAAANQAVSDATAVRNALQQQKSDLDAQTSKYQALLTSLTPVQQTAYRGADNAPVPANYVVHAGNAAAQTAIDFALAQRGKPYQYAASGPNAYDCSGLTMAAWAAAGVSLPHQSAEQYNYGTHVSLSDLQPGDLVFFYSPISHVAIYLGNGMIVHAPTSGDVVKVSPMFSGAVGATRLT